MVDLSIIIVSFNTKSITKKCLDTIYTSLKHSLLTVEIVVFDNGSTDSSLQMLKQYEIDSRKKGSHIAFKLIRGGSNLGFVKANNSAAKDAKGKYILFLNSDIEVLDDAIDTLYDYFANQTVFNFVGAKLFNSDLSPQQSCGPTYNLWNIFLFLFLQGDRLHITRYSPQTVKEVAWVSGACFITEKIYFESLSGFDEKIFMYMEEIDLFYRAMKKKMRIGFFPHSHFIHLGSASSEGRTQPILQVYKGYLYFYKKHFKKNSLVAVKTMLQLKAVISLALGRLLRLLGKANKADYLKRTYTQAYEIAKNY
jgi:GT2 family glycosyltransferase